MAPPRNKVAKQKCEPGIGNNKAKAQSSIKKAKEEEHRMKEEDRRKDRADTEDETRGDTEVKSKK